MRVPVTCPIRGWPAGTHSRSRDTHIGAHLREASSEPGVHDLCKQGLTVRASLG